MGTINPKILDLDSGVNKKLALTAMFVELNKKDYNKSRWVTLRLISKINKECIPTVT